MKRSVFIIILILFLSPVIYCQDRQPAEKQDTSKVSSFLDRMAYRLLKQQLDTTYIKDYKDELSVRLVSAWKGNFFNVIDQNQKTLLRYRPDNRVNVGIGITYQWFSLDLLFNFGINPGAKKDFKSEQTFDIGLSLFTNQHFVEIAYKYYLGNFISEEKGLTVALPDSAIFRSDLRYDLISLDYLYALNYKKFSFKSTFVNNEAQLKSAGSPIFGLNYINSSINGNTSVVPEVVRDEFDEKLNFDGFKIASLALNAGYMYTFVFRGFYLTLGLIPGMTINSGDRSIDSTIEYIWPRVSWRIKGMNGLGFSKRRFYLGATLTNNYIRVPMAKRAYLDLRNGKAKVFIGYRIRGRRVSKK